MRDLLAQSNYLSIRDNGNDGITVTGLSLVKPNGAEDLLSLLRYGNSNRTQHPTDHNAESSRSHAVFQVDSHKNRFHLSTVNAYLNEGLD